MPGTELLTNNRSTFLSVEEAGQIRDITVRLRVGGLLIRTAGFSVF